MVAALLLLADPAVSETGDGFTGYFADNLPTVIAAFVAVGMALWLLKMLFVSIGVAAPGGGGDYGGKADGFGYGGGDEEYGYEGFDDYEHYPEMSAEEEASVDRYGMWGSGLMSDEEYDRAEGRDIA
jgi:hypothetical protein